MADMYTIPDDTLKRLAESRAADAASARSTLAGPIPPPPIPPVNPAVSAAPAAVAAPVAAPVNKGLAYRAGQGVGLIGKLAANAAVTAPLTGFGDYKADTGGIDTSAGGTLGYLKNGEFANAGSSLSGGAAEALADSGRGIAKLVDGAAGLVGAKPNATGAYDNLIQKQLGGYLSLAPTAPAGPVARAASAVPQATATPAQTEADRATKRVGDVIANNPQLGGNVPQPAALDGGGFMTMPSSADADRAFLAGAFQRHLASGDLERARATAVSPDDMASLGAAEGAQVQARDAAYRDAPIISALQAEINRSPRERALDEDPRTRAFNGRGRGRNGAAPGAPTGVDANLITSLQAALSANKGPSADPVAALAKRKADDLTAQSTKADIANKQIAQQNLLQVGALQKALITETDPTKREQIKENIQVLTGKYEKAAPAAKAVLEDYDTGKVDGMNQPIYKKRAINPETGEPITKPAAAAKPTRAQLEADAQSAIKKGGNKDAVNAALAADLKRMGL